MKTALLTAITIVSVLIGVTILVFAIGYIVKKGRTARRTNTRRAAGPTAGTATPTQAPAATQTTTPARTERFYSGKWFKRMIATVIITLVILFLIPLAFSLLGGVANAWRSFTTPKEQLTAYNSGKIVISENGVWSNPLPYLDDYRLLIWEVEKGKADRIVLRDANSPDKEFTFYFDGSTIEIDEHIYKHQWKAVGLKDGRPLTISYRIH